MQKLNVFGQPINESEREKNCALINDFLNKTNEKNQAQKTINECNNEIASCDYQIKEKNDKLNEEVDFNTPAQEVSEKAFKELREKNAKKFLPFLNVVLSVIVIALTVLSLMTLFPMIKDFMDSSVIVLLVGAPIALIVLMPSASFSADKKKGGIIGEIIEGAKEGWNGTDSNKEEK